MADVNQVARTLDISPRRVQQLVQIGMPRNDRGDYELGKCMHWYIRYLQNVLAQQNGVEFTEPFELR